MVLPKPLHTGVGVAEVVEVVDVLFKDVKLVKDVDDAVVFDDAGLVIPDVDNVVLVFTVERLELEDNEDIETVPVPVPVDILLEFEVIVIVVRDVEELYDIVTVTIALHDAAVVVVDVR